MADAFRVVVMICFFSIVCLILVVTSALSESSARFRKRDPLSQASKYSRIRNVDAVNSDECGQMCLRSTHCSFFHFDTNTTNGPTTCVLYSHNVYNGTLEQVDSAGKLLFERFENLDMPRSYVNETYPQDCTDLWNSGQRTSGAYLVRPRNMSDEVVPVYCDMDDYPGGWTVIHKRFDGSVQFHDRSYSEYESFFGDPWGEYWAGLKTMNRLTDVNMASTVLKVELEGGNGQKKFAVYDGFVVQAEDVNYKLYISGYCPSSTLPDEMTNEPHLQYWSAKDQDNDVYSGNCGSERGSGWWWKACGGVALNSNYNPDVDNANGVNYWRGFYDSGYTYRGLKGSIMKIRRFPVRNEKVYTTFGATSDNMQPCAFPWVYDGVTYNSCTTRKHFRAWCRTTADGSGPWGNCETKHDCKDYYFRRGCLENRHCYRMVTQATDPQTSVDNAQAACKAQHPDGHLLNLETAEEHTWFINTRAKYAAKSQGLLMGIRKDNNGVWRWEKPYNTKTTHTKWHPGQPDGNGPCSQLFADPNLWDDMGCTSLNLGYICEYHDSSYP